jgi:hypothetical protein
VGQLNNEMTSLLGVHSLAENRAFQNQKLNRAGARQMTKFETLNSYIQFTIVLKTQGLAFF